MHEKNTTPLRCNTQGGEFQIKHQIKAEIVHYQNYMKQNI